MMTIELQSGEVLKVEVMPDATEKGYQFIDFTLEESVLGPLPKATLTVKCKEDLVNKLDEGVVSIIFSDGSTQEGKMYVYDMNYYNNQLTIKLMGCSSDFTRTVHMDSFSNMNNALNSILMEENLSNISSDINNDIHIYQMNETNYHLCTRLLKSWKKGVVFGYCLDGVRMIDLLNYQIDFEDSFEAGGNLEVIKPATLSDPKLVDKEIEFIDYSDGNDPNHLLLKFDKSIMPVNTEYKDLIGNMIYNQKYESMASAVNYHMRSLHPIALCQSAKIQGNKADFVSTFDTEDMFLASRTIYFRPTSVEVDYTFKSINP